MGIFERFYQDKFEIYEDAFRCSNEKSLQSEIYYRRIKSSLKLEKIRERQVRVLDIGCGKGTVTNEIIEKISDKTDSFSSTLKEYGLSITGIDPVGNLLEEYEYNIGRWGMCEVESKHHTLQEFTSNENRTSYDIILCDHSLYTVESENLDCIKSLVNVNLGRKTSVALFCLSSKFSPVMTYRRRILDQSLTSSEDVIRCISEMGLNFSKTRYHSNFDVNEEDVEKVGAWIRMNNGYEREYEETLQRVAGGTSGDNKFSFKNVADIIQIDKEDDVVQDPWSDTLSDLFLVDSGHGDRSLSAYINEPSGDFANVASGRSGFRECGSLHVGPEIDQEAIQNAHTFPLAYYPTHREENDVNSDVRNDLIHRFRIIRESNVLDESNINYQIPSDGLDSKSIDELRDIHKSLISEAFQASSVDEIGDELRRFTRRWGHSESEIGTLWIDSGEHCFYSLVALLRSVNEPIERADCEKILKYGGFSTPNSLAEGHFLPSKKLIRLISWVDSLITCDCSKAPKAIQKLSSLLSETEGMSESVGKITCQQGALSLADFERYVEHLNELIGQIDTRAVPEICFFVSAGVWCEAPNLLIFRLPQQKKHEAFGFLTCADIDDVWFENREEYRDISDFNNSVVRNILQLVSIFRHVLLSVVVSRYESLLVEKILWDILDPIENYFRNRKYDVESLASLSNLSVKIIGTLLKNTSTGGDGINYERVCNLVIKELFGGKAEIYKQKSSGTGVHDIELHLKGPYEESPFHGVYKYGYLEKGDPNPKVVIECKNSKDDVDLGQIRQIIDYCRTEDTNYGVLMVRNESITEPALKRINDEVKKSNRIIDIWGDNTVMELLSSNSDNELQEYIFRRMKGIRGDGGAVPDYLKESTETS